MLPLSLSGTVCLDDPSASPEDAVASIVAHLEREKPSELSRARNGVDFTGGMLGLVAKRNALLAISHGEIRVERAASAGAPLRVTMQPRARSQPAVLRATAETAGTRGAQGMACSNQRP